ncbi:hypothetical protein PG999_000593 [Apiospora kogelbergensis]|uniref:ER-bound oxygenase mpaB/mpaB'/Rubber oxygenase catalytic domain-containing protein n=1 Tax=Apiospora kogelbergensis TaxID=1337665 RepID=A0AAW0RBZ4_9PEZI
MDTSANASSSTFSSTPLASIVPLSLAPILAHIIPSAVSSRFMTLSTTTADPAAVSAAVSWKAVALTAFLGYALLCRTLRFRREKAMRRKYGFPDRASLAKMTTEDAQLILRDILTLEFPQFGVTALQFGLFKTYGVESISRLLLATRNLTDPVASLKRYEDTAVVIGEFTANPPGSARSVASIARMNFLHSKYVASGQISNADLLYTLSVFITDPERFMRLYEWRPLNDMEYCAYATFWKSIGEAMGIQYSGYLSKTEWRDGVEFGHDIAAWAKKYEVVSFIPSKVSNKPAVALIPMITYWLPGFMKDFAQEGVTVLLGDRVREAFMLPEPGITAACFVYSSLALRRAFLRHLSLPRFRRLIRHHPQGCESPDQTDKRIHLNFAYGNYPFYIKPTLWNRWGPEAWAMWLAGGKLPGDNPETHFSEGFMFEELGPLNRMGQGKSEMEADIQRMNAKGMGGCPFG